MRRTRQSRLPNDHKRARSRRRFLTCAAIGGAAGIALAVPVHAQGPLWLRFQSAWPAKHIFYEYALDFAKKVNDMSGGDLRLDMLPLGAAAPASGLLEAVHKGLVDGAHAAPSVHFAKHPALALWGSSPAFGMDANMLLAWHKYGGGRQLLAKVHAVIGADVISFLSGPQPPQPLGWFKKRIARAEDLSGLRLRTDAVAAALFEQLGAQVTAMPEPQAVAAIKGGALDGAELTNAAADSALGMAAVAGVCMVRSYHQSAEQFEILVRRPRFDSLPARVRAIIENAAEAASQDVSWKSIDRYSRAYLDMRTSENVTFHRTPDLILERQLAAYDELAGAQAKDALVAEIERSQKAFAERALRWQIDTVPEAELAYRHYFAERSPRASTKRKK
jgi:TRAP-type mannitol/chloroaromatic compound transport system substrate-binding protein